MLHVSEFLAIFILYGYSVVDYFLFGLVFIKKIIKLNYFLNKKTKTSSNRSISVRFGSVRFFRIKHVQTGLARFFLVWLGFFSLSSVWFSFFDFRLIKPEPNWLVFSKFNQVFLRLNLFNYFFDFSLFLLTPIFT
jgi:hypothetical protein